MTGEMKKTLLWIGAGLLVAIVIFLAGMRYEAYKILSKPTIVTVDTNSHNMNIPPIDTTRPAVIIKPDPNRQKYIDSLIAERKAKDSLETFIASHLSIFGVFFKDSTEVKDKSGTVQELHWYNIWADPIFKTITKKDSLHNIRWSSYDTTTTRQVPLSPTIGQRLQDAGILVAIIVAVSAGLYFVFFK